MPVAMRRKAPATVAPPPWLERDKLIENIRRLIWLYFLLLIFEGALRKWIVPRYSDPLLIIRDPIAILIYLLAIKARVFPRGNFMWSLVIISLLCWTAGILVLLPYLPIQTVILVTGYGFRSNFLHLPLLFIIPGVFNPAHVRRMGWWIILGMIPMALLMAYQFHAAPDSFINRTVGLGEAQQIQTGGGKIRPPGTFSFISGAILYLSAAAAFLLHAALSKLPYKNWILGASGLSVIVGIAVSGSRSAVLSVGLILVALAVILVVRPSAVTKFGRVLLLVIILGWALGHVPIFREGVGILSDRFTESAAEADTSIARGMVSRVFEGFFEGFKVIDRMPWGGYGLGIGTNGGARFLVGRAAFLLAENEWARILLESGPFFGLAFLLWRAALTFRIGYLAFLQLLLGRTLPLFLFAAGFYSLIGGPFGQPTNVGFAVLLMGLCLAAGKPENDVDLSAATEPAGGVKKIAPSKLPSRSAYSARLHQPIDARDPLNDSVDR
ncbi:MAG: hypothetical protein QOI04_2230 [Verrucomicrobiota bacterium]